MREAAAELRRLLDELGIAGFPKTTGNRGLHVYVRLEPRNEAVTAWINVAAYKMKQ